MPERKTSKDKHKKKINQKVAASTLGDVMLKASLESRTKSQKILKVVVKSVSCYRQKQQRCTRDSNLCMLLRITRTVSRIMEMYTRGVAIKEEDLAFLWPKSMLRYPLKYQHSRILRKYPVVYGMSLL